MLATFRRKFAGKTVLISLSLLDRAYKFTLGCFANLQVVLLRDFLDLCDFHFLLSFLVYYDSANRYSIIVEAIFSALFLLLLNTIW